MAEIANLVGERPTDYSQVKNSIITQFADKYDGAKGNSTFHRKIVDYIYELPFQNSGWKRKHLYFLILELIEYFYEKDQDIGALFYDMELYVSGDEGINIQRYPDEPQDDRYFRLYIENTDWI